MFNILVVEDEKDILNMICDYLKNSGFNTFPASNGEKALDIIDEIHIDLIITDIMMPELDGYSLVKEIRESGITIPILMLTAKESIDDKEVGFKVGTDDYMVKPVILRELVLRANALLKRANTASSKKLKFGSSTLDYNNLSVTINGENIEFPKKEFMLLYKLLSTPNKIFTRYELLDEIWGYDTESSESTVNVHISRIREKLNGCTDFEIITVKGLGIKAVIK